MEFVILLLVGLFAAAAGRLFKYQTDTNVVQDKVDYLWIMKVIGYK